MNLKPGKYRFNSLTASLTLAVSLSAGLLTPVPASASVLLPKVPLFVNISTTPNIFLQMDDSGSMDWDILMPTHFTTCRYNYKKYCSNLESTGEFYDWTGQYSGGNRIFRTFEYVETSQDDAYSTHCYNSSRDNVELCGGRGGDAPWDWRVRSSALNVLYFNPNIGYSPWPGYSNASFGAARSYPDPAQSGYYDTDNLSGFVYHHWIDDKGFSGTRPDKTDDEPGANDIVDEWDSHVQVTVDSGGYSCKLISYPNVTSSGLNPVETDLLPSDPACKAATGVNANLTQLQQNVANWFQYYRRRNMVARASVARVVTDLPSFRYGFSMINDYNLFVEVPEEGVNDYSEHNAELLEEYLEYQQKVQGTPLRRGLERVGRYYDNQLSGKEDPIVSACQKNFSILFSDGYWNGGNPYIVNRDIDRDGGYIAGTNVLLADVAKYYYERDLSPLPNLVPTDQFDSASHQHMVTFTVGFGINGSLIDTDDDGWPDNLNNGSKWYTSDSTDEERKVDDLWHAAWNSRGEFISAKRPEELIEELSNAILEISDRIGGAASGATNGGSISSESKVFQAKFDAVDWHGSLLAINVDSSDGELDTIEWEAGELLDQKSNSWFTSSRNVLTYDRETDNGAEFKWASLNDTQQQLLNTNPANGNQDGLGQQRVNYIRGSSDGEGSTFRNREHRLGDIAHSDPEYVSFPPFYYPFDGYQQFALANRDREAVIYVGANDGMLHAFNEETGQEMFAFVPNEVMHKLPNLTYVNYYHDFFVDGSPIYGDIQSGLGWKSVLIGSFRSGGQGLYALDITDPGSFTASDVMWEFTDEDDPDLGYVFGEPQIRKMANGKWAAIFTSGYNNSEADGNVSPDGDQFVYILNIEDGTDGWSSADYRKIALPSADGLSAPAVADVDGDSIADFIYVGDLDGNMWKIDVTASSSSSWNVAFSGEPLFVAKDSGGNRQPITSRPAITRHPRSIHEGVLVLFGTGKYLEVNDDVVEGAQTQSIYAIWDRDGYYNAALSERNSTGDHGFRRSSLNNPRLDVDSASNNRVIHDYGPNTPIWFDEDGEPVSRGWVVDLPVEGERVVRNIILRDNIALLVTLIPEGDACSAGGSGWFMALNAETGGSPRFPVIDINDDNIIDEQDTLFIDNPFDDLDDDVVANPVGIEMLSIPNLPALLYDDRASDLGSPFPLRANAPRGCGSDGAKSFTYTTRTNGSIVMVAAAHQPLACGRQSWMQTH